MNHLEILIQKTVAEALLEDMGPGDVTTQAIVPQDKWGKAKIIFKETGILAGLPFATKVFSSLFSKSEFTIKANEGAKVSSGEVALEISAPVNSLLIGERTALNFLQRLSGIATLTSQYVEAVAGSGIRILDTRKTTPTLRAMEKYAVQMGGGVNYRHGLYDAVMIKDNHVSIAGGITPAIERVLSLHGNKYPIIVEARTLGEVKEACAHKINRIMLDNMDKEMMMEAIKIINKSVEIEVSGGITVEKAQELASLEVDYISAGALTNRSMSLDISMYISV